MRQVSIKISEENIREGEDIGFLGCKITWGSSKRNKSRIAPAKMGNKND